MDASQAKPLDPLPLELRRVAHRFTRLADDHLASAGISLPRFVALSTINDSPGIHGAALAQQTTQTAQSLGAVTAALEADGLLRREVHGRRVQFTVTTEGRATLRKGAAALSELQDRVIGAMTTEQRHGLQEGVQALHARMDELS